MTIPSRLRDFVCMLVVMAKRGTIYLVGSTHGSALPAVIKRVLQGVNGRTPRVAASYAAIAGDARALTFMEKMAAKLFGVDVSRIALPGEHGVDGHEGAQSIIESADVVFLGGGDPVIGARTFAASRADAWLRAARERGAEFVGISAGAIMLCDWWASWPDELPNGAPFDGGKLVPCTGVVPRLVVDCHAEEDDWAELLLVREMLRETMPPDRMPRMLGLPHGGGIAVDADGNVEPVGVSPYVPASP